MASVLIDLRAGAKAWLWRADGYVLAELNI